MARGLASARPPLGLGAVALGSLGRQQRTALALIGMCPLAEPLAVFAEHGHTPVGRIDAVDDAVHMRMRLIAVADDNALQMGGVDGGQRALGRPQHLGAVEMRGFVRMPGQAKGVNRLG